MKSMENETNKFYRLHFSKEKVLIISPYKTCPYEENCPFKSNGVILCEGTNKNRHSYFYCNLSELQKLFRSE